jgi:hypothetical protein
MPNPMAVAIRGIGIIFLSPCPFPYILRRCLRAFLVAQRSKTRFYDAHTLLTHCFQDDVVNEPKGGLILRVLLISGGKPQQISGNQEETLKRSRFISHHCF